MQLLYFGVFDPAHTGHVRRITAVQQRWAPSRTLIVPLDYYDGTIPGRRIVRSKMASALADATGTLYTDSGLAVNDLQALVARLARAETADTLALFDPELPPGLRAEDVDAVAAGVEIIADTALALPTGLPDRSSVQRLIRDDHAAWQDKVVGGVAAMVTQFGLYGWSPRQSW
ncbi:MAG: hypothetical protein WD378_02090 [Egicoccus sp.]